MTSVFADTSYWIALLNPKDALHDRAVALSRPGMLLVTTEMVLTELLNEFAARGPALRAAVTNLVTRLKTNQKTTVVPQSTELFHQALQLYSQRIDKDWGVTDCASFVVMERHNIKDALTYDHDFEQAGFRALLR